MKNKLWYLKNLDLFSPLRNEELHDIIEKTSSMTEIKRGETLYHQGFSNDNIYILKKGTVKISKVTAEGKTLVLDIFKGVTLFGELSTKGEVERDETAEVVEDGVICYMSKADFEAILKNRPEISIQLNKLIGSRKSKIENKLLDLLYRSVKERLAKTLLNLINDFGMQDVNSYLLKVKLTHEDFSELIASTRETTTATLNKFKKDGLIDYEGKYIKIIDKERLALLSEPSIHF
jgi:CRP-like cAMP-binding protein